VVVANLIVGVAAIYTSLQLALRKKADSDGEVPSTPEE
jgi:hypothetical protein